MKLGNNISKTLVRGWEDQCIVSFLAVLTNMQRISRKAIRNGTLQVASHIYAQREGPCAGCLCGDASLFQASSGSTIEC